MSESNKIRDVEPDQRPEPMEPHVDIDCAVELILEADDHTPEEAGYGHGV